MSQEIRLGSAGVHQRSLVWDCHMDTLQAAVVDAVDLGQPSPDWPDLGHWRRGGIRAQVFAVWVDTIYAPLHAARRATQQIQAFHALCARHGEQIALARTAGDVRRIVASGKLAGLLSLEGGWQFRTILRCCARSTGSA